MQKFQILFPNTICLNNYLNYEYEKMLKKVLKIN